VVYYYVASHDSFATVSFRAFHTFLAQGLNGLAENFDGFSGCIAAAFFFDEFLNFAGHNENVRHDLSYITSEVLA
jgi:hypothetical protein